MLYWNTVTPTLKKGLLLIMREPLFEPFCLVGGTSLSLQLGHRKSIDIDLFTDANYGSIDFEAIDALLRRLFPYLSPKPGGPLNGMGVSYFAGNDPDDSFKLDLYYTDPFIFPAFEEEGVRMATVQEIIAMKVDIVQRGGRKKDFWDLHELADQYSIETMISLHKERYPYDHDEALIRKQFVNFSIADEDLEPDCLRGQHWELIRLYFAKALGVV